MNKELMSLIINLNESVRMLGSRFEIFQHSVDEKLLKQSSEFSLLKNKVDFIEKNCLPQSKQNSTTMGVPR